MLSVFADAGHLGAGHGRIAVRLTRRLLAGQDQPAQWRAHLSQHRDEAMQALSWLT